MSCHCCPCDHSGTIRQYFSNINLWTNSKVSQLDRQSDESAGYHCDGEGCVIKEQRCCPWCWNPLLFQPLVYVGSVFFLVTFFSFFWEKKKKTSSFSLPSSLIENHLVNLNSSSFHPTANALNSSDRYISSAEASGHHSLLQHVTSWGRISPLLG